MGQTKSLVAVDPVTFQYSPWAEDDTTLRTWKTLPVTSPREFTDNVFLYAGVPIYAGNNLHQNVGMADRLSLIDDDETQHIRMRLNFPPHVGNERESKHLKLKYGVDRGALHVVALIANLVTPSYTWEYLACVLLVPAAARENGTMLFDAKALPEHLRLMDGIDNEHSEGAGEEDDDGDGCCQSQGGVGRHPRC